MAEQPRTALLQAIKGTLHKVGGSALPNIRDAAVLQRSAAPLLLATAQSREIGTRTGARRSQIYELEATVTDFNGDQQLLHDRINELLADLAQLQARRDGASFEVPVELLRYPPSPPCTPCHPCPVILAYWQLVH